MENLVGRKVKCITSRWSYLTLNKVYEINKETNFNFYITNDDLLQDEFSKHHIGNSSFELLPNEPQFKQGDKVLVSDNGIDWVERIFVFEYKGYYNCELNSKDYIISTWKHIKPYEGEIKIGDWVFLNDEKGVCKITDKHDLKEVNNKFTLVKNPQLIELLNNEL